MKLTLRPPSGINFHIALISTVMISVAIMILQDYLGAIRRGGAFYITESILFKCVWFLFIPILSALYIRLRREDEIKTLFALALIIAPILLHLSLSVLLSSGLSSLFYDGRYVASKFFSYTLANDLYLLLLVYPAFIIALKFFTPKVSETAISPKGESYIMVRCGTRNEKVFIENISHISAETPYVKLHLPLRNLLYKTSLAKIESEISMDHFVRIHRSVLVNMKYLKSYTSRKNGDYDVLMEDGSLLRLSRTYLHKWKKAIERHQLDV